MRTVRFLINLVVAVAVLAPVSASALVRGIYLTQYTAMVTSKVKYYIQQAKASGIDTFVIDYYHMSRKLKKNVALIKQNNIHYVARIVMFPHGALPSQVTSQTYLNKRYQQIMEAVSIGADEIQLDYIRYKKSQPPSKQNARNIDKVIQHVSDMLKGKGVKLQIDIFGVAAHSEALYIGQNAPLFADKLHAICPMVYPSHYEPFRYHATRPYQTVYDSLVDLRKQLKDFPNVKIYAYIELYNYRYPLSRQNKINYILAEMRAVRDADVDGWYAWSARNKYSILFAILRNRPQFAEHAPQAQRLSQEDLPALPAPR